MGYVRQNMSAYTVFALTQHTRKGVVQSEIAINGKSPCLRAYKGGASRIRLMFFDTVLGPVVRYMTPREYARLQGAPDFDFNGVSKTASYTAMGEAVTVPVIQWIADHLFPPEPNAAEVTDSQ